MGFALNTSKVKYFFLNNTIVLILIFLLAELVVNPSGEFPLNDDWAYTKSVEHMDKHSSFDIGWWPAMSLLTHVLWGFIFTKFFGFSFFALRLSVLCLSLLTVIYFEKFIYKLTQNKVSALLGALCLLFNPLFFNLSNSYMTDVSFLSFSFFAIYHYHNYCLHQKKASLMWLIFFSLASIFVRQLGLIIPLTLLVVNGFNWMLNKNKQKDFIYSIGLVFICFLALYLFEWRYVAKLQEGAPYQGVFFSKAIKVPFVLNEFTKQLFDRLGLLLFYSGLFVFPIIIFRSLFIFKMFFKSKLIITIPLLLFFLYGLLKTYDLYPIGNTLYDCGIGFESTIDMVQLKTSTTHAQISGFLMIWKISSLIGIVLFCLQLLSIVKKRDYFKKDIFFNHHFSIWLITLFLSYAILIATSAGLFDRYSLLPSLLCAILMFKHLNTKINSLHFVTVLIFAYFSVFATKDYFNFHKTNQKMVDYLITEKQVAKENIHAGFEYNLWNFYADDGWSRWNSTSQDYIISFKNIKGYHKLKTFKYRRYFPYRQEKLYILKKD